MRLGIHSRARGEAAGASRGAIVALVFVVLVGLLADRGAGLTDAGTAPAHAAEPLAPLGRSVPALLYHGLIASDDGVTPERFEAQMRRMHDLGFSAITLDTYVRSMSGKRVELPKRPMLITFDDGYRSSWKHADRVLARYGWSAAMYIPTGFVGLRGRLTWPELRLMRASGRWQIDEHAGNGHVYVPVDAAGTRLPFYAATRWVDGNQESFAEYKLRIRRDIELGAETLARHLPGWRSHGTFALPYGDYGQRRSNDSRIAPWLSGFLKSRFAVTFARAREPLTAPESRLVRRIAVPATWDSARLETRLVAFERAAGPEATTGPR